jgi:hypothetical protein
LNFFQNPEARKWQKKLAVDSQIGNSKQSRAAILELRPWGPIPEVAQPVWRRTPSSVQAQAKPSARAPTAKGTTSSRAVQVAIKKTSFSRTQKGRDRSRPDFYGLISYF